MQRSSSWMSDEDNMDCRNSKFVGSVTTSQPFGSHRHRPVDFREYQNRDDGWPVRNISSSTRGTITNSRYRRSNGYSTFENSRRPRHRTNDMDMYRVQEYDNVMHAHNVGGLLRQHSWSGSNVSLGSNRSRSSANRDRRPSGCNRQCDDTDSVHMRTNNSHSVGTKLEEYDDSNATNVTYVAAGTAPVSTFRGSSCGANPSTHSTAVPIATYGAPLMPQGGHTVSTYQSALNFPIDQCDLHHFDQGVSRLNGAADDRSSPSSHLMFNRKVSDIPAYATREAHSQPSSAYFCHQTGNERVVLALLNMLSAYQQQRVSQRQAGGLSRYMSELDCSEEDSTDLSATLQQQQLNTGQISEALGA
uniref:Uncharacterized protein n=1 Tax=Haemonchus contortus TaxID=6289 RepID=A0A7I4XSY6_HAECO|nr:unnamed protein product [Haemonchus contortus]